MFAKRTAISNLHKLQKILSTQFTDCFNEMSALSNIVY